MVKGGLWGGGEHKNTKPNQTKLNGFSGSSCIYPCAVSFPHHCGESKSSNTAATEEPPYCAIYSDVMCHDVIWLGQSSRSQTWLEFPGKRETQIALQLRHLVAAQL